MQTRLAGTSPIRKDLGGKASATHTMRLVPDVLRARGVWLDIGEARGVWCEGFPLGIK